MGYLYMPEQTKAVIGDDGFMSTGDVDTIDHNDDPRVGNNSGKRYLFLEYRVINGP